MKSISSKLSRDSRKAERRRKKQGDDEDDAYTFAESSQGSSSKGSARSALSRSMQQHAQVLQDGDGTLDDMVLDDDDFGDIGYAKPLTGLSSHRPGMLSQQQSNNNNNNNNSQRSFGENSTGMSSATSDDQYGMQQQQQYGMQQQQHYPGTDSYTYSGGVSTLTDPTMMNSSHNNNSQQYAHHQQQQQQQQHHQTIDEGQEGEEDSTYYTEYTEEDDQQQGGDHQRVYHRHPNDGSTMMDTATNGGGTSILHNNGNGNNNNTEFISRDINDDDNRSMGSSSMGSAPFPPAKPLRDGSGRSVTSSGASLSSSKKGISLNADHTTIGNVSGHEPGGASTPLMPYNNNNNNANNIDMGNNNNNNNEYPPMKQQQQQEGGWQDINDNESTTASDVSGRSRSILKNSRYSNNQSVRSFSSQGDNGMSGGQSVQSGQSGRSGGWGGSIGRSLRSGWGTGQSFRSSHYNDGTSIDQFRDEPSVSGYSYDSRTMGGGSHSQFSRSHGGGSGSGGFNGGDAKTVYTAYTSATSAKRFQSNAPMKQAAQVKALVCLMCFVISVVFSIFYVSNGNIGLWMTSYLVEHDPITTIEKDDSGAGMISPGTLHPPAFINSTFGNIPDLESMNLQLPFDYETHYADWTISFPAANLTDVPVLWTIPRAGVNVIKKILGKCYGLIQVSSEGANRFEPMLMVLETPHGERYLNVDSTTIPGLNRAMELQLAQSGLAEVMYTHLIPNAGAIFTKDNSGRLFTIFRNPLERAMSLYNHAQNVDATAKTMNIVQFANDRLINNEMTRTLLNKRSTEQLTEDDLFIAMEILRRKCVVGLATHIEESLHRFLLYFGWSTLVVGDKVPMCQQDLITNVNKKRPNPPKVGTDEYNALLKQNNLDVRLYEYARYLFDYQGGNTRTAH